MTFVESGNSAMASDTNLSSSILSFSSASGIVTMIFMMLACIAADLSWFLSSYSRDATSLSCSSNRALAPSLSPCRNLWRDCRMTTVTSDSIPAICFVCPRSFSTAPSSIFPYSSVLPNRDPNCDVRLSRVCKFVWFRESSMPSMYSL